MTKPTYAQMLLDPRWQRKRLEVLQAANFACKECGAEDITLHVHHGYYRKGAKPWEYPDDAYHVLCATCHEQLEHTKAELMEALGAIVAWYDLETVLGYVRALTAESVKGDVQIQLADYHHQMGMGHYLGLRFSEIESAADSDGYITLRGPRGGKALVRPEAPPG